MTGMTLDVKNAKYATGRRKSAISRIWIAKGSGKVTINKKNLTEYFNTPALQQLAVRSLSVVDGQNDYDVWGTVKGGGLSGQAGAVCYGISCALVNLDDSLRKKLKEHSLRTRDSRVVERKKYGKAKARKSFQFSKR